MELLNAEVLADWEVRMWYTGEDEEIDDYGEAYGSEEEPVEDVVEDTVEDTEVAEQ